MCHERWFRFSTYKLFASFVFSTKSWSFLNSPNINKNLLFEVIVVFCYFFRFSHMYIACWGFIQCKKDFTSVSLLPFTKKLGTSSYDVTMTHYDVILIWFFFTFVANVWDLWWDNCSCSNYEQKRSYKDLFAAGKNDSPGLHRPKIT